MKPSIVLFAFFLFLLFTNIVQGQDTIYFKNPSFEGAATMGGLNTWNLSDWTDCGQFLFPNDSSPDVHSKNSNIWGVSKKPQDGKTFLGLVTRFDGSFESVSQTLATELKAGHCYSMSIYLCQSPIYDSRTRRSTESKEKFVTPTTLRIWGGNKICERTEKLHESEPKETNEWTLYTFIIQPLNNLTYLSIETYLPREQHQFPEAYNGHLLLDHLSPIIEISCED